MSADLENPDRQSPESLAAPTDEFVGGMVWHWGRAQHPYIQGGYCSPVVGKGSFVFCLVFMESSGHDRLSFRYSIAADGH